MGLHHSQRRVRCCGLVGVAVELVKRSTRRCMWSFEIVNQVLVRLWTCHRQRSLTGKRRCNEPLAATLL